METEAQKRAEAAFAKKARQASEANVAWREYKDKQAAIDSNTERLRALRLAREGQVAAPPARSTVKSRTARAR